MKKLVIGAAVAGAAVLACRKMHDRCREMFAGRQELKATECSGCSS